MARYRTRSESSRNVARRRFLVTEGFAGVTMNKSSKMEETNTKEIIDYTAVPAGWQIKGHLWTGQPTVSTATCPKCERIGVISSQLNGQQIIVHSGRVVASGTLLGIDYCKIAVKKRIKKNSR